MSCKKVAIVQSNYIPWKGYFDLINMVDEFIIYDDAQYTRRDWRNRNRIKTPNGPKWITIPVGSKGKYLQKIKEVKVSNKEWNRVHWETFKHNYARASCFNEYSELFENLYLGCNDDHLSQINCQFIKEICTILGIKTKLSWSMDYELREGQTERLVGLCKSVEAYHYVSGPAAKDYIQPALFEKENIKLSYMDYSGYPEYNQLNPPFDHYVSILDLIFNEGSNAPKYMKSFI